jgi:siroheme synthase
VTAPLVRIAEDAQALSAPALVVVGEVVELAAVLAARYETSAAA